MNVRFGLACLGLIISCWCCAIPSVSSASNGVRPRRQSRRATLNEYLTPPAPPNAHNFRGPGFPRHPRNQQYLGSPHPPQGPHGSGPPSSAFRQGKILTPPPTESPGYFARLMGWLNPFGSSPIQRPPPPQPQRPEIINQDNFNSGHVQTSLSANGHGPPAQSYGPPASSYGPPENSYKGHVAGKTLPQPPLPPGSQPYLPPEKPRNCNPCNQVPWIPLYHGINTDDARYAAGSSNVALPESSELGSNQHNGGTNVYQGTSISQEIRIPDFNYGRPQSSPVLDPNYQASSVSAQLNKHDSSNNNYDNHNQNFNHVQPEYRSPFIGPIPNPHLYPGAMPPLFKATPFAPKSSVDHSQPEASFSAGRIHNGNSDSQTNVGVPSLDLVAPQLGSHQSNEQAPRNGFNPSINNQYNQQVHNVESPSSVNPSISHQESASHYSEASLHDGYVDELPPGAETVPSGPDDFQQVSPSSINHANDNGAANSDYGHILHSSSNQESQSTKPSIDFSVGQNSFQGLKTKSGSIQQSSSYESQVSTDGQHVIHYEQSPVIDLSSIGGDEKPKKSNDSSASSSTSSGTVEDPPVILQNPDGTYGINATWPIEDSSKVVWPENGAIGTNVLTVTTSTLPRELSNEKSPNVKFQNFEPSSTSVPAVTSFVQKNRPNFTEYLEESVKSNLGSQAQGFQDSRYNNRTNQQNYDSQQNKYTDVSREKAGEQLTITEAPKKSSQGPPSPYPGLVRFEDSDSYGFRLPDLPPGSTSEEPFLKALMKSYINGDSSSRPGNRLDPRKIHPGAGFKPSWDNFQLVRNPDDSKLRLGNRQQGAKKNKQVQIIIPYTSQYTPEPFHPMRDDWSTKTLPVQTQPRKVPNFNTNTDYLAEETRRVEDEVSQIFRSLKNSSRGKEVAKSPNVSKTNTSIDVLRLQKNIDNWTIQEYSRGTTVSTEVPKFSRPYLSPSKQIPDEYLTTTEPVVSSKSTEEDEGQEIDDILAGFSFNDLEHESSASDHIDVSHVQVSPHLNEVSSVFPESIETTTAKSPVIPADERDTWKQLPVSISPLNKERVYVVTPQTVSTLPTKRRSKSYDKPVRNETTKISMKEPDLDQFESIERAYQVLPQAVNNLVVASTGPATIPLWGIMEHEKYASASNDTAPESPILYAGHSKVSRTGQ